MIIDAEYRWEIKQEGEAYTATLIAGKPFIFRFAKGERTPSIGCRVNHCGEVWTGECTEHPDTMREGMKAADAAKLYAQVARDAGDALVQALKQFGE